MSAIYLVVSLLITVFKEFYWLFWAPYKENDHVWNPAQISTYNNKSQQFSSLNILLSILKEERIKIVG